MIVLDTGQVGSWLVNIRSPNSSAPVPQKDLRSATQKSLKRKKTFPLDLLHTDFLSLESMTFADKWTKRQFVETITLTKMAPFHPQISKLSSI